MLWSAWSQASSYKERWINRISLTCIYWSPYIEQWRSSFPAFHQLPSEFKKFLLVESRIWENLLVESGILGFGIRNTAQGIRKPSKDCNPESKFHWQRLESSFWNPESTAWNLESKTVLDSLIWGEDTKLLFQTLPWGKFPLGDLLRYLTLCETVTMLPGKYPTVSQVNRYK